MDKDKEITDENSIKNNLEETPSNRFKRLIGEDAELPKKEEPEPNPVASRPKTAEKPRTKGVIFRQFRLKYESNKCI